MFSLLVEFLGRMKVMSGDYISFFIYLCVPIYMLKNVELFILNITEDYNSTVFVKCLMPAGYTVIYVHYAYQIIVISRSKMNVTSTPRSTPCFQSVHVRGHL